jgi:hypothetical protein
MASLPRSWTVSRVGDTLLFTGDANAWSAEYTDATGVLTVLGLGGDGDFTTALQSVQFVSSSAESVEKNISYTLLGRRIRQMGPIYVPSATALGRYYEFHSSPEVTQAGAASVCAGRSHMGATGSLVSILSTRQQSQLMSIFGGQVAWLAAQGVNTPEGSMWRWMSPRQLADPRGFFVGDANVGNSVGFTYWAAGQPSTVTVVEPLFAMTQTDGTWTTATATSTGAAGFFCMYEPDTVASPSAAGFATLLPAGCIATPCQSSDQAVCLADPTCKYAGNTCSQSICVASSDNATQCNNAAGCYFDPTSATCLPLKVDPSICTAQTAAKDCVSQPSCGWTSATKTCAQAGCAKQPNSLSCGAMQGCKWAESQCVDRVCGATSRDSCMDQSSCTWNAADGMCEPTGCLSIKQEKECATKSTNGECTWNTLTKSCEENPCPWDTQLFCNADPKCVWLASNQCGKNDCLPTETVATCGTTSQACYWNTDANQCVKKACLYTASMQCNNDTSCIWDDFTTTGFTENGTRIVSPHCRTRDLAELDFGRISAAAGDADECIPETSSQIGLICGLCAVVLLMVGAYFWLRRRQNPERADKFNVAKQLQSMGSKEEMMMYDDVEEDFAEPTVPLRDNSAGSASTAAPPRPSGLVGVGSKGAATGEAPVRAPRKLEQSPAAAQPDEEDVFEVAVPAAASGSGAAVAVPTAGPVKKLTGVREKKKASSAAPRRMKQQEADDPFDGAGPDEASTAAPVARADINSDFDDM